MHTRQSSIATYATHEKAEAAVLAIQRSGFDMTHISIVGGDYHTNEHALGFYNTGDRVKAWGREGAFWGGLWGILFGSAFLVIPGIGPLFIAGPLVGWIAGVLEGAVIVGGMGAIGAGLYSIGIPKDSIITYESALQAGKFLVVIDGTDTAIEQARQVIAKTDPEALTHH